MKHHLVYEKNGHYVPAVDVQTEAIDQGYTDASVTKVFLELPLTEITKTNERESKKTLTQAKKYRPFSIELYNEILHNNKPTTSSYQTELQVGLRKFKLPVSNQYDPENINSKHKEERIDHKMQETTSIRQTHNQETIKIYKEDDDLENLKKTARKIITENLEKAVAIREGTVKGNSELNIENNAQINSHTRSISQTSVINKELKQECLLNKRLLDEISDIPKSVKETVNLYEFIDTTLETKKEIKPEDNDRKLFLLQEIEESIEEGLVKKKSTVFENQTKSKQLIIKGRQKENNAARKVFSIGSETIQRIKRTAESRLSKHLLNEFLLYLTNIIIKLTRHLPIDSQFTSKIINDRESISKRKLSSTDIVQLVLRKPNDLTQRMDTVISEFHSKLNINNRVIHDNRRSKSVTRDETNNKKWLNKMDKEETEQMKEEIKLATLTAARRMLGRRRSYHNLTDIENGKIDGLTYIAIVESHVYTNRNAIFDDYISRLKTQVDNVLEITDVNEMVATECIAGKYFMYTNNQRDLSDKYTRNTEDFQSKLRINETKGERIDYVATVTVEHKQTPAPTVIEKSKKSLEINKLAINESILTSDIQETEVKEISAKVEDRIEVNETKYLKEVIIPTPIVEEIDTTTIHEAANQINELFNEVQKDSVEITELNEELPMVNIESINLSKVQVRGVETIEEVKTDLHETKENEISCVNLNASATVLEENRVIAQEPAPIIEEVREVKKEVAKETTAVSDFTEAGLLTITELIEETPTISVEEEKLTNAHVLNQECIRQTSEVYYEVDVKGETYHLLEDKGLLTTESGKIIATKVVNETNIYEELTVLPEIEIKSDITAKSKTVESHLESALSTCRGTIEFATDIETAVIKENSEIEKEIAITTTETEEFENAQIVAIATARQTSEVYNDVENNVEITEIKEELPTVKMEAENFTQPVIYAKDVSRQISAVYNIVDEIKKEDFLEDKALEVVEIKELTTALKLNYADIEEINTSFNQLDLQSFYIEKNEEFAKSFTEVQELIRIKSNCIATTLNIDMELEESENFEVEIKELEQCSSLEVTEEIVKLYTTYYAIIQDIIPSIEEVVELPIDEIEQEVATSNIESKFHTVKGCCVSVINNVTVNLHEVSDFETPSNIKEESTEHVQIEVFNKAQSLITEICQEINIPLEEIEIINIDVPSNEIANVKEVDKVFDTIFPIATPCLTQLDIILIEVDAFENECMTEEHASYEEEEGYLYSSQGVCIPVCNNIETHLEECNILEVNEIPEESAITFIEENVFESALSICTSISNETYTIYIEADNIAKVDLKEEKAELSEEENHFSKAYVTCNAISENIKVLLEVTNELIIDQFKEEYPTTQMEPEAFITALAMSTSVSSEIITIFIEAELIPEELFPEENAILSEEENNYFKAITTCKEINQDIELLLEETNELVINKLQEDTASPQVEPQILLTALAICTSILKNITISYIEAEILLVEKLQEDVVETSLEENHYIKALKSCVDISQYIELLLEESTLLLTEELKDVMPSTSIEPFVLEKSLPLSTSILNDMNEELYKTNNLIIEVVKEVEANVLIEVSKLTLILAICVAAIEEIYKDLEECKIFKVGETKEEICNFTEEPLLIRNLPTCVSIIEHINYSYNSAEILEIKQMPIVNADTSIEAEFLKTILCICTSITETIITKLDEATLFKVDKVLEHQAEDGLEPQISPKLIPICTATVFILKIPVFEIKLLETENFEQKKVSESLEIKDLSTAQKICHGIVEQDDESLNEVQNTSISYETKEDNANLSYEDIQLNAAYAVSSATANQLHLKYDIAENYESNIKLEQVSHSTIESQDFTIAHSINNATATNEYMNLLSTEYTESSNFVEESAVIKIEPKHENIVLIEEINVSHENGDNKITKARKKKNIKAISTIKDETDIINIKESNIEENYGNFDSLKIEELKENDVINEQIIITEEPIQLKAKETQTIKRKKSIKQKSSNAVDQESNIQSNIEIQDVSGTIKNVTDVKSITEVEPIIENFGETTSVNIQQYKETNNEANVNISISKTKAKNNKIDHEMSYNLTLVKPQVTETVSVTNEDTLRLKTKKNLKQQHTEEIQEELNLNLDQDNESGVAIEEIIDSDENIEDIINIENRNDSIDASIEFNLQSQKQNESKDVSETSRFVKRRNKDHISNQEESADLTIFRKDVVLNTPVIDNYDEVNSKQVNTYLSINEDVSKTGIISSQSTDFKSKNTEDINKKGISKKLSRTNVQSINIGLKKETHKASIKNGFSDLEINAESEISAIKGSLEKIETNSISQETRTLVSQEFDTTIITNKSKSLSLKTNLKREEIDVSQIMKTNESSPEIDSPTKPPTPLTDEYIFRLTAPLPKSRGTTPAPREPSPEIHKEQSIVNQNLVPTIESVTIERVVYNPPLPTPPTSPVHSPYTKPGLNGGMKQLPRYFKPGLRGGSDRPPVPKEEILEVRKQLSTLTSDINETLKNIERYKKIVEVLKQQKAEGESSKIMEEEKTEQTKLEEIDTNDTIENSEHITTENPINEQPSESKPIEIQTISQTDDMKTELNNEKTDTIKLDIKRDFTDKIKEARIKGYDIKEISSFEELEKECENTGVVELAPDTAGDESIQKEINIITEDSQPENPESSVLIKIDKDVEESGIKVDVPSDEEQKTADEEVARVIALTIDRSTSTETSPSVTDTVKEAHVISITRVLSSHMLREGLSPDCQKMKDKFENKKNVPEEKINGTSWTTFLQKSTNLQTETLGHFADLQNKFEKQEPFATKLDRNELRLSPAIKPRDFNSSPIPWQERKLTVTLGVSNVQELTPGDEPQFFIAIPTESKENIVQKSTVIPVTNLSEDISNIKINKELNAGRITEHAVHGIIQEATRRVECLNIGDGKNRLIQLLLNNVKNIAVSSIPVEDQINQIISQLETLEQVPDIIRETFESVAEKLYQINKKKEETLNSEGVKYQELEPKVSTTVEISIKEGPQIKEEETKVEKMQAETKGALLVKDKKPFAPQMQETQKPQTNRPQQKFGWMKPEPRPIKLFGGRRWRRPGEEYTEEQIAETILAHSELIHGKTMGINFMKYEKPPLPLDHLQHSEVFKLIHNTEQTPQKPVELLSRVISEADYRERCRSLSPCPPEYYTEY